MNDNFFSLSSGELTVPGPAAQARCDLPPWTVVFLVHNPATWDALAGIHECMQRHPLFEPVVITLPRNFNTRRPGVYYGEEEVHEELLALGVPHQRFNFEDHGQGLARIKALNPALIFRQSPWDPDIPPAYRVDQLAFTRLAYTDYGIGILKADDPSFRVDYDQELHRAAWLLCCANDYQKAIYMNCTAHRGVAAVTTGYPKFDRIIEQGQEQQQWPFDMASGKKRVIWSPHHSVDPSHLGFGTFHHLCWSMLEWVIHNQDRIEVVLKPHPMLFESQVHGKIPAVEFEAFLNAWVAQPNTSIVLGGDYGPLFAASDLMITDGVTFLVEYPLFDKPLVWIDSQQHVGFNELGELARQCLYPATTVAQVGQWVEAILFGGQDPLSQARHLMGEVFRPFPGQSAQKVVATIEEKLRAEAAMAGGGAALPRPGVAAVA